MIHFPGLFYCLRVIWVICLGRLYHFNFFKDCLPQILLGPFLNALTHININPDPTTVSNNSIPWNTPPPPHFITALYRMCLLNAIVMMAVKHKTIPNGRFSKKRAPIFYIWILIVYYLKLIKFVANIQRLPHLEFIYFEQQTRYWKLRSHLSRQFKEGSWSCMLY